MHLLDQRILKLFFLQHLTYWIPTMLGLWACVKLCSSASRFLHLA